MFFVRGRIGVVAPPNVTFETLNTQELTFDAVHYAATSTKYSGSTKTVNGDSVGTIKDKIGSWDMFYAGLDQPTITGVPPQLIDDKWLMFDNRPGANYNSDTFSKIPSPYEVWLVSRNMPGQRFEAKMQGAPISSYLGDDGSSIRIIFNNCEITGSTIAPSYEIIIERLIVNPMDASYYVNGSLVGIITDLSSGGQNTSQSIADNTTRSVHSIAPYTNAMDFDFGALYFKSGSISSGSAATIYSSLASKWGVGTTPTNQILLNQIRWVASGSSYVPEATVSYTPPGVTVADPSTWDYQWYWKDLQTNYNTQTLFSTNRIVNVGDFPADDGSHTDVCIKFRVRPKDTNGNSWRYISGLFELYGSGASEYSG